MPNTGRPDHILVWMRDSSLGGRVCRGLERRGFATTWAASLPEAIAAIDRDFPCAVACTLRGRTPPLIDLETVYAYLTLGHGFVSLPPVPIWALTSDPARYATDTEVLGMPVRLVPYDAGVEGLVGDIVGALRPGPGPRSAATRPESCAEPLPVLLLLSQVGEATFLARYLGARHMGARVATEVEEAIAWLDRCPFGAVVAEDAGGEPRRRVLWEKVASLASPPPIVLIASGHEWLRRASPLALPRGVACTLRKPIRAQILEACLRRLLRVAPPHATAYAAATASRPGPAWPRPEASPSASRRRARARPHDPD